MNLALLSLDDDLDDSAHFFDWDAHKAALEVKKAEKDRTKFWNEDRVVTLTRMWKDGCRVKAIAATLGTTRNAVISKAHGLCLPPHSRPFRDFTPKGNKLRKAA